MATATLARSETPVAKAAPFDTARLNDLLGEAGIEHHRPAMAGV